MAEDMDHDSGRVSPVLAITVLTEQQHGNIEAVANVDGDDIIKSIDTAQKVLQRSFVEAELCNNLKFIENCLTNSNDEILKYSEEIQLHQQVLSALRHVPVASTVQQVGLHILYQLCEKCENLVENLVSCNIESFLIEQMMSFRADPMIQKSGIGILVHMLSTVRFRDQLLIDNQEEKVACVICVTFQTFPEDYTLQCMCACAVCYLLIDNADDNHDIRDYICKQIGVHAIELLHKDIQCVTLIQTLHCLYGHEDDKRMDLVEKDVHLILMELCTKFPNNSKLMSEVTSLLSVLTAEESVQKVMTSNSFVQNGLFCVMEALKSSEKVQRAGLRIMETLIPTLLTNSVTADETAKLVVKCVYTAMFTQIDQAAVQIAGCRTLIVLLEHRPEAHKWIGENVDEKQDAVHTLCVGAMLTHRKDYEVFVAACEAIFWIAADNERLCTSLMYKNVHIAITNGLKRHHNKPLAVETGCRALRGLCIFLHTHKEAIVRDEMFPFLLQLQQDYTDNIAVQIEVLSTIACLADVDIIRHQCFVEKIPAKIIECMRKFVDEPMMQETGLEAFAVLAGAEGGPELLRNGGVLTVALEAMIKFKSNAFIIKKGLIVLQLLAIPKMRLRSKTRKIVISVLNSALKEFSDIKGIQSEACVAIQLHAESDANMSKAFVDAGCHEYLFRILEYDSSSNSELQELSSECLYVLSQEQNLKSIMLLSACKNGTLPATECLIELGADVNFGENFNTPLYVAVSNKHEKVVKCLLKQDIQDLKTPLKESLRQESHVISGLLLQQMGYDKENNVICWNNLELDSLEDKWIFTTLTNTVTKSLDTDVGRFYIDKIKNSAVKRNKRKLTYSHSDSSLKYPHVRLRHKIVCEPKHVDTDIPQRVLWKAYRPVRLSPAAKLVRSKSVDDASTVLLASRRPGLPTIMATSPGETSLEASTELPELEISMMSQNDDEWREMTLSGAGVFYSSQDPRFQPSPKLRRNSSSEISGNWKRKPDRSQKTNSTSSDEGSPALRNRKMSAPNFTIDLKQISGQKDTESTSEVFVPESNECRSLHWLDVSENSITDITALISSSLTTAFIHLDTVDIKCNKIKHIPDDLHLNMPNLHILDAAHNEIEQFPDTLLQSKSLIELRLGTNKIRELNLKYQNFSLEKLDLSWNQLKRLPEDEDGCNVRLFHNMREICLAHNDLMALPEKPIGLQELQSLDLSHNQIDCLPDLFLMSCSKLETLDLSFNILTKLPDDEYAENLPMLYKLKVRHNHLAERAPLFIPRFILELSSIRTVDISENQICGFPSLTLWKTRTMKDFIANRNKIPVMNLKDCKVWSKLEKLHLAHNQLTQLPQEIGYFTSLISLDISHNKITSLPDELGKCSKLYEMPTDGLELNISRVILGRRVKDIIKYLHNRLTKAQRYYRMKLMVVGYGGRGKTTLLKTLMKEKVNKKENRPTVGVVVKDWTYSQHERRDLNESQPFKLLGPGRKVQYTLNTWDFAGQEEFYSTHDCYLANRAVYLVVFDLRKGTSECEILKTWLLSIRTRAPGCPVIIVGTHLDKLSDHRKEVMLVTEMIREFNIRPGYPNITSVYLVNALNDNEDMESLRNDIKRTVDSFSIRGMRVIGEKIPSSYVELSEVLTSKAKSVDCKYPVIQHRELLDLVQKNKILLEEDEIPQAVQFLHEVGVLLHYDDASLKLRDYYFIDPGWLCRMMAQIITVPQINPFINKEGILRTKDIKILFRGEASFPEKLIPQYIKLLEKFEIALPHSDTELMIPCRLPIYKPNIHPPGSSKIVRIYRMPYVPIGLWFRLIARLVTMTTHDGFKSIMSLGKPQKTVYWRKGVYVYYSELEYFLLDSSSDESKQTDSIQVTVPSSDQGSRLLGQIIDSLDTLIDEWYPGLTCIDPLKGEGVLDIIVPCNDCSPEVAHTFTIKELRSAASKQDHVYCPLHEDKVLLKDIAPDLVMGDLEIALKLDTNQFDFTESSDKQLGDGAFGDVYRATYKTKEVAVKVFKEVAEVHALTLLRQEVTILRCLKHPSVVCMIAVGIRPPVIVMELAPHGTLSNLFKSGREFKRALQHRVAVQVAAGLKYLHSIMIVFRDMKPENVLIFNTSLDATINAKISDYGIARITTLQGLRAQEGTPGYRAPEVVRKENYSFEADVFSYGLTMYVMMTGRHPFDYMDSRGEMDKAVGEGLSFPPPESKVSSVVWPDMKAVTLSCLSYDPKDRPSSENVWQTLRRPEIIGLQRIIPVSRATTVECLCVEEVNSGGRRDLRLWIASGDSETFQLSYKHVSDPSSDTRGLLFNYGRILCMQSLGNNILALGTQIGKVWIFDTQSCKIVHASSQLQDSVLCMNFVKSDQEGGILLVGLANGKVAICPITELIDQADMDPVCLYPGQEHEPVLCMTMLGKRVFLSCGTQIVVLNTKKMIAIDKIIDTAEYRNPSSAPIYTMAVMKGQILFTKKSSSIVEIWDATKDKINVCFDVAEKFDIDKTSARVTSMIVDNSCLWIGTHGGHIGIIHVKTLHVLAVTHRYRRAVRSLVQIRERGSNRKGAVFSGGQGFKEITKTSNNERDECGCVLVWDVDFPQHAKSMIEYEQRRKDIQLMDENNLHTYNIVDSGSE
ncbi:Leucine-rich repeat serine/threonine-protein kinase 2 [Mactra antiquata]